MGLVLLGALAIALLLARPLSSAVGLSATRRRALAILDELVPSAYPDARFLEIVGASFNPHTSSGTTCGALPCALGRRLGDPTGITRCGVPGVETEGRKRGAWIAWQPGRRPRPGDIYLTAYPDSGAIAHTGVVGAVEGDTWTTVDAGQGPAAAPRAARVVRHYDPRTGMLTRADNGAVRRVVGWIDLDEAMEHVPRVHPSRLQPDGGVFERHLYAWPCDPGEC